MILSARWRGICVPAWPWFQDNHRIGSGWFEVVVSATDEYAPLGALALGALRELEMPTPYANGIDPADHQVGAGRIKRSAAPVGAVWLLRS